MNLSFTLDEKILTKITPKILLEKVSCEDVSALELAADRDILSTESYLEILNCASENSLDVNYHIPYFTNEIYDIKYFKEYKDKSKAKYREFLNLLETFQPTLKNNPIIVLHGEDYIEEHRGAATDNTKSFIDFLLNEVSKRNLPFTLALETLRRKTIRNTFDNRDDLFVLLDEFNCDTLSICWDMCHDKMNFYPNETPVDKEFLSRVSYAHIHGHKLDSDLSHLSLINSDLDYSKELKRLGNSSFNGCINIELLSSCAGESYLIDLFNDIDYLKRFL